MERVKEIKEIGVQFHLELAGGKGSDFSVPASAGGGEISPVRLVPKVPVGDWSLRTRNG